MFGAFLFASLDVIGKVKRVIFEFILEIDKRTLVLRKEMRYNRIS